MKKLAMKSGIMVVALAVGLFLVGGAISYAQETETVTVRTRAKPPMENWRGDNFLLAAEEVNADLKAAGDPRRVEIELIQDNTGWGDYVKEFVLGYGAGEAPDIWLTGHEYIGAQAEAGRIIAGRLGELEDSIASRQKRLVEVKDDLFRLQDEFVDMEDVKEALSFFGPVWDVLYPKERIRVINLLVDEVAYDGEEGTLEITFHPVGIRTLAAELCA